MIMRELESLFSGLLTQEINFLLLLGELLGVNIRKYMLVQVKSVLHKLDYNMSENRCTKADDASFFTGY